jgi:hypothetical protein
MAVVRDRSHIHGYLAYRIALRDGNASIRHEL